MGVSPRGLLNWVERYGKNAKSPSEVAQELQPSWFGILGIDGKELKIKGQDFTLLIAQDLFTFDPVFFTLVEGENVEAGRRFFLVLRDVIKYPIQGVVSDLGRGRVFISLIEEIFPGVPHQACVVHFLRYVNMTLPKSKKSLYYKENLFLRDAVANTLLAPDFNDAEESLQRLLTMKGIFKAHYHKRVMNSLIRHFDLLTAHLHHPFLLRDNNITENLIKQLNRKLKTSGGFKKLSSAYNFLKLWFIYYRFKPFTNSSQTHRNGKAPLELAKANIKNLDWLAFSQKNRHS